MLKWRFVCYHPSHTRFLMAMHPTATNLYLEGIILYDSMVSLGQRSARDPNADIDSYAQMPRRQITVAIDFGTTRSAWAYTVEGQADNDIMIRIPDAAGDAGSSEYKTPTAVLIEDGGTGDFIAYGRAAEEKFVEAEESGNEQDAQLFRWIKLGLCQCTGSDSIDRLTTKSTTGKQAPLLGVMAAALGYFKDDALSFIYGRLGDAIEAAHVHWVLTVPAIYNDFAKHFMRRAAFEAGITDKINSNKLQLCLEPEAACLAITGNRMDHPLDSEEAQDKQIMILDCGGGTVDITIHTVDSVSPLKLTEAKAPTGGTWGATYVDRAFQDWLRIFLGHDIFAAIAASGRLLSIMDIWENRKAEFDGKKLMRLNLAELSNQDVTAADVEVQHYGEFVYGGDCLQFLFFAKYSTSMFVFCAEDDMPSARVRAKNQMWSAISRCRQDIGAPRRVVFCTCMLYIHISLD